MDLGLAGQVFLVGGGSQGLGRATATALIGEGADVVITSRDPFATAEELGCSAVRGDLADPELPAALVTHALETYGRLDGALVNVGGPPLGRPMDIDDETWESSFRQVFLGPLRLSRVVARHLKAHDGGSLCFVLSTSAVSPITGLATSNALRPGLAGHVRDLAVELGPPPAPVRVNAVLPGSLLTERVRGMDATDEDRARRAASVPLRRLGDPAELGRVAAFLLSPAASFVTGALVPVDGGILAG